MTERTEGPWYVGRSESNGVCWIDSDFAPSSAIADLYQRVGDDLIAKENAEANASYIVQACNAYPTAIADTVARCLAAIDKHTVTEFDVHSRGYMMALREIREDIAALSSLPKET